MNGTTEPSRPAVINRAINVLTNTSWWISGKALATRLGLNDTRELRSRVIWPLRSRYGLPVHSRPGVGGGYKLKVTAEEHADCLQWNENMGRDFFAIQSILRDESLDLVMGQMVLSLLPSGKEPDAAGEQPGQPRKDGLAMLLAAQARKGRQVRWLDVLTHLLDVLAERPDVYAEEIDAIGRRFGGLFLTAEQRAEAKQHLDRLDGLIGGKRAS